MIVSVSFSRPPLFINPTFLANASHLQLEIPRPRAQSNPHAPSSPGSALPSPMSHSYHDGSTRAHLPSMPSFSLVGALEFRHVVSALQQDATGHSLSGFDGPVTPYAGGHYHHRPRSHSIRTNMSHDPDPNPFDAAMGVQLHERALRPSPSISTLNEEPGATSPDELSPRSLDSSSTRDDTTRHASSLGRSEGPETESQISVVVPKRGRVMHAIRRSAHILFPSLQNFRDKSILGQIASVFAAPAIMLLTVTLPVVVTPYESPDFAPEKPYNDGGRLIDFEEEGEARALIAEVEEEQHEMVFNKWLMAGQCVAGPLFCALVLTS